ncbi:MAG: hypothetical protein WCK39_03845 [Methanomassiliicoccales archaeon]
MNSRAIYARSLRYYSRACKKARLKPNSVAKYSDRCNMSCSAFSYNEYLKEYVCAHNNMVPVD